MREDIIAVIIAVTIEVTGTLIAIAVPTESEPVNKLLNKIVH